MSSPNSKPTRPHLQSLRAVCTLTALMLGSGAWAQSPGTHQTGGAPGASSPVASDRASPDRAAADWSRLPASQRLALAPLAGAWSSLHPTQQRKWLEVSKNFSALQPAEQAKMHERMKEWAGLSPRERAQARLNFGKTVEIARELSPAEKMAKWEAYQALPAQQRQKLAEQARARSLGAAPAVQPVPAQKLAVLPPVSTARAAKPSESSEESSDVSEGSSTQ